MFMFFMYAYVYILDSRIYYLYAVFKLENEENSEDDRPLFVCVRHRFVWI